MRRYVVVLFIAMMLSLTCGMNVHADGRQLVIIGDSRTEDLHAAMGDSGCIWSHKVGEGLYWMRDVGVPQVEEYIGGNSAVVILMGVNDAGYTGTAHEYVSYINAKAAEWAQRGAVTYYFSVCPINESIYRGNDVTNSDIIEWNDIMRNGLSSDVTYVDIYDEIMAAMDTPDGMHYNRSTSQRWFELIEEAVAGNPNDPGVLTMPELTYDRVNVWIDTRNGRLHYDEEGNLDIGLNEIDGDWYYFNNFGYMVTGLVDMNGQVSMFDDDGKRMTGLVDEGGRLRYFDADGIMQTGLVEEQGEKYYFDDNGIGASGSVWIGNDRYVFESGRIQSGLVKVDGKLFYCEDDGKAVTGWAEIDGERYYFEDDGAVTERWNAILPGEDQGIYYFDADGHMVTGWVTIDGEKYHFEDDGKETQGWVTDESGAVRYYSGKPYALNASGFTMIDGTSYYFTEDNEHVLATGWFTAKSGGIEKRFYAWEDGQLATGFHLDIDDDIYLFGNDGGLMWECARSVALFIGAMVAGAVIVLIVILVLVFKGKHKS